METVVCPLLLLNGVDPDPSVLTITAPECTSVADKDTLAPIYTPDVMSVLPPPPPPQPTRDKPSNALTVSSLQTAFTKLIFLFIRPVVRVDFNFSIFQSVVLGGLSSNVSVKCRLAQSDPIDPERLQWPS